MRLLLLAGVAALPFLSPAQAAETPRACGPDPRERCVAYAPGQIVRIYGAQGATMAIELPPAEKVSFVGKSDNSLIAPSGEQGEAAEAAGGGGSCSRDANMSICVPKIDGGSSNIVMLTPLRPLEVQPFTVLAWWTNPATGEKAQRRHTFELLTRPGDLSAETPDTFFAVRFTDPVGERLVREQKAKEAAERARTQRAERAERVASARLQQAAALGTTRENRSYDGQGTPEDRTALAPMATATLPAIWDDGQRTYLRYPGNRRPPMPYQVFPDGTEAVVGQSTNPDAATNGTLLVLHGVFPMIRLRDGTSILCIVNRAYDPVGQNPGTGTVSPDVLRVSRSAEVRHGR